MANGMLLWRNLADAAALSGGSWDSTQGLAQLQTLDYSDVARSADLTLAATRFDVDLGDVTQLRALVLGYTNLTTDAAVRVRVSEASDFSTVTHDTGWTAVYPAVFPSSQLEWEDPNWWSGQHQEDDLAGYPRNFELVLGAAILGRHVRVELDDQANPAGYLDIGRLLIARGWQFVSNFSWRGQVGWEDPSVVEQTIGGAEIVDERPLYRVVVCDLEWMDDASAFSQEFEIARRKGITGELYFAWDPDDQIRGFQRHFFCRRRRLSPIEHIHYQINGTGYELRELK